MYAPGDLVTVIRRDAELKHNGDVVGTASVGDSFEVGRVEKRGSGSRAGKDT